MKNIDQVLQPISSHPTGVPAFLQICSRLTGAGIVTQQAYMKICQYSRNLAESLLALERDAGATEVDRVISLSGGVESDIQSPWLAITS